MRKAVILVLAILIGASLLPGCSRQVGRQAPTPTSKGQETSIDNSTVIKSLYEDLYIGEACKSGFVYIEPFSVERTSTYGEVEYKNYSDSIEFYPIHKSSNTYKCLFDSLSNVYIPNVEEDSNYYWQGFAEPNQSVLRYKQNTKVNDSFIGVSFFDHKVSEIDYSCHGKKRIYSNQEYDEALKQVEKCKTDRENIQGALREITIEDTLVGAEQICLIKISGVNIEILLSKYFYMGVENTADVYVIDFINDSGEVVQTYQKYNWVSY